MAVTLIAVIFALVLSHLAPGLARGLRRYGWFTAWLRLAGAQFPAVELLRGRYAVPLMLLPPLLALAALQWLLHSPLAGLGGLLLAVAVLFYAWGPRDLDQDVAAVVEAEHDGNVRAEAAARLGASGADGSALVEAVFASALRRWFGVLFWFLLLGATGALLYRLCALAAEGEAGEALPEAAREGARTLYAWLDWPVAQAMVFALALAADFDTVVGAWRDAGGAALRRGHAFLGAAARASVRCEIAQEAQDYIEEGVAPGYAWAQLGALPELRDAMSLIWRILLLWLAVLALFVVAGFVG